MQNKYPNEYYEYLSHKLDSGESDSPVLQAFNYCLNIYNKNNKCIRALDIGCFNGAMINRLNKMVHNRAVEFFGIDTMYKPLKFGLENYKDINFCCGNIQNNLPLISGHFDIIIASNIIHEIYSESLILNEMDADKAYLSVQNVIANIKFGLAKNGLLIIQEGIKPKDYNKKIIVEFLSRELLRKFDGFVKDFFIKYDVREINKDNKEMTIGCLYTFLTKVRYIDKDYWVDEKQQLYQIFTDEKFLSLFSNFNLILINQKPEFIKEKYFRRQYNFYEKDFCHPVKNMIYVLKNI